LLIALVAITHVLVSHFAIGGGAYLVVTEHRAYRRGDEAMLDYVRRHSQFFALLTLVYGAVTGVGIWFTIGLVSPEATSSLIHTFVWAWAIEWVFFFVEIAAAIIYAKSWDTLSRKAHLTIGWIYFVAAWMSLFFINGIITYQLTPGRWLQTHNFWDGFFNPTFLPSLFARSAVGLLIAGCFGLITLPRRDDAARESLARWAGGWTLAGAVTFPLCLWWYFAALPGFSKAYFSGNFKALTHGVRGGVGFLVLIVVLTLMFAVWKPRALRAPVTAVIVLSCLGVMGASEYMREWVRKPWVIQSYVYANDVRASSVDTLVADGVAKHAKFLGFDEQSAQRGRELFVLQCGACHSVSGYRGMARRVAGWDAEFAKEMLAHIEVTKGAMPRFGGNEQDRMALGAYLASLNPPAQYPAITDGNAVEVGAQVFAVRCGSCHTVNGKLRPLRGAFERVAAADVEQVFPMLDSMSPNMPKFTAPAEQAKALAAYIANEANKPITATAEATRPATGGIR
jgi:mono/diheme cytochrome c family protein